ncbi:MAG: DUF362 domain-containing protein [Prevotellaceae bacterium]|jgi:uncharacterized Fe-S center protein|nr:DUF362 domain-containing protein [Prevotellaceae bacterium]
MVPAKVYYTDLRTSPTSNLLDKMERLMRRAGFDKMPLKDSFVAIKIHFGEPGNLAYLRPNYAVRVGKILEAQGAKPFLTDCNTLYSGRRSNAVDHLASAMENGYNPLSAHCQVIIADGLKGTDCTEVPLDGEYCKAPKIGTAIMDADIVMSMNHFKGHEQAGFGGALKNLGMGCASVQGKLELHSASQPVVDKENCIGCNICVKNCAHDAIHLNKQQRKAEIDYDRCVGCGQCVALCQYSAAVMGDEDTSERLNCKIAEYALAVLKDRPNFHLNFIMNVSPECDCWGHNDAAVVPDLGILASFDPVALDKACADMVIKAPILHTTNCLSDDHEHDDLCGDDKFHLMHPNTDWLSGLRHAEKIGLGTMEYELISM